MKCPYCGASISRTAERCDYCDSYLPVAEPKAEPKVEPKPQVIIRERVVERVVHEQRSYRLEKSPYSRWVAFFLCLLFGWIGVHRFYVNKIGTGILWLMTFGMFGIGWAIDALLLLCGAFRDKRGLKLS